MDINKYLDENYRVVSWELDTFKQYANAIKENLNNQQLVGDSAKRYADFIIELADEIQNKKWASQQLYTPIFKEKK